MTCFNIVSISILLALAGGNPGADHDDHPRFLDEIGTEFDVEITQFEGTRDDIECSKFELSEEDVDYFFRHAVIVDGRTKELQYGWFPCSYEGKLKASGEEYSWSIGAAGTADVQTEEGEMIYLVCESECAEIFPVVGKFLEDEY